MSARKPKGAFKGWLSPEYPGKLVVTEGWDDMKWIINHKPIPGDVGTMAAAIKELTKESAVDLANGYGWGLKVHKNVYDTDDMVIFTKGVALAFVQTIKERCEAHLASRGAEKRHERSCADPTELGPIQEEHKA